MEHLGRFRKSASRELNTLENALKEVLARRDEQISENRRLQNEIGLLQQQVARVSELEDEVRCLKEGTGRDQRVASTRNLPADGMPQVASFSPLGQPYVKIEHLEKWRQQFLECSRELERVREARDVLEGKARHFKTLYENLRRMKTPRTVAEEGRRNVEGSPRRRGSAPARQSNFGVEAKSNQGQSTRYSMSGGPAQSTKTWHGLDTEATLHPSNKAPQLQRPKAQLSQGGITNTTPAEQADDDSTETSDESEQHLSQAHPSIKGEIGKTQYSSIFPATSVQPDFDEPIVVSERSLKRKRDKPHPDMARKPKPIKVEFLSSSPNPNVLAEGAQESIDLDEVSGSLSTPRKDQRKRQRMWNDLPSPPSIEDTSDAHYTGRLLFEDADERPESPGSRLETSVHGQVTVEATILAQDLVSMPEWVQKQGQQSAERVWTEEKRKRNEDRRAQQKLHNERQLRKSMEAKSLQNSSMQKQSVAIQNHWPACNQALQPIDTNRPLPRTSNHPSNRVQKMIPGTPKHAQYIHTLSEDGEPSLLTENALCGGRNQTDAKAFYERAILGTFSKTDSQPSRLNRLLAAPSPDKPPLSPESAGVAKVGRTVPVGRLRLFPRQSPKPNASHTTNSNLRTPATRLQPKNTSSSRKKSIAPNEIASAYITPFSKPRPSSNPTQTDPLRSRPISHLCLEDFRINPKHNQGFEYAFKEVVRKPEQRKCLPGCTRPDCCGTIFRKMAETGMYRPFHTTLAPAPSQEDEDQQIMQDFLGPGAAGKLRRMTGAEKAETLLQAKTKILADHFGRHREVYAREPSPVGFWDVDMPNSQEAKEQGRLAEIRMRQKVEERWREAKKGDDGVWKFRDE